MWEVRTAGFLAATFARAFAARIAGVASGNATLTAVLVAFLAGLVTDFAALLAAVLTVKAWIPINRIIPPATTSPTLIHVAPLVRRLKKSPIASIPVSFGMIGGMLKWPA